MENKEKPIKVNCSFCRKEIECPEGMLEKVEGHICFQCFKNPSKDLLEKSETLRKFHVDIPTNELIEELPEIMASQMVEEKFPDIWKGQKEEFKEMSKRELAEEMYFVGASDAIFNMLQRTAQEQETIQKDKKEIKDDSEKKEVG